MRRRSSKSKKSGSGGGWIVTGVLGLTLGLVLVFAGSAVYRALPRHWPALLSQRTRHAYTAAAPSAARIERRALTRVEVWNGSGMSGAGQKVAEALRDGGFLVTQVRNADRSDYGATLVVDRKGNPRAVREVIEYFHGGYALLQRSPTAEADVRVVVGRDHEGLRLTP